MPTEDDLREQFHEPSGDGPGRHGAGIDVDAVLRRSRARRRPRVIATAAVSTLAVLGIVVPISVGAALGQPGLLGTSSGSAASGAYDSGGKSAPEAVTGSRPEPSDGPGVSGLAPADKVNLCTGTLAEVSPAENGLVLTVAPVTAAATDRDIPVTVTLTNTGDASVTGTVSPFPSLTLSRDGVVLWHSNGLVPQLAQLIDLAPGASTTFTTSFQSLSCGVADDEQPRFRDGLPAVPAGTYQLSALLDVSTGAAAPVLVSGPLATVTLTP